MLEVRRQEYIDNLNGEYGAGMKPHEIEVGGSFRIRTRFWSGSKYLTMTEFETGTETSVGFRSQKGDHFRMHLHTPSRRENIDPVGWRTINEHIPSAADVSNAGAFAKYGIKSLFATPSGHMYRINGNGVYNEIY